MTPPLAPAPDWQEDATETRYVASWKPAPGARVIFWIGTIILCAITVGAIATLASKLSAGEPTTRDLVAFAVAGVMALPIPLWLEYVLATATLNTIRVVIDSKDFRMVHTPIPQLGKVHVPLDQISRVGTQIERSNRGVDWHGVTLYRADATSELVTLYPTADGANLLARRLDEVLKYFQAKAREPYR